MPRKSFLAQAPPHKEKEVVHEIGYHVVPFAEGSTAGAGVRKALAFAIRLSSVRVPTQAPGLSRAQLTTGWVGVVSPAKTPGAWRGVLARHCSC